MIPLPKIKCKRQAYRSDGACAYLDESMMWVPKLCLKQNCIFYEGENNEPA